MKIREIIGIVGLFKFLILLLASTFWIMVNGIPYVPFGLLVIVYFLGKQEIKIYIPFILMAIIGFVGTGLYVHAYKETRMMLKGGEKIASYRFKFAAHLGTETLDRLLKDNRVVIFNNGKHQNESAKCIAYVRSFEEAYQNNDSSFMVDTFVYQNNLTKEKIKETFEQMQQSMGGLEKSTYLGYIYWIYPPKMNHQEISIFYKTTFEKGGKSYTSMMYRFVLDNNETKLTHIRSLDNSVKFRIVK